MIGKMTSGKEEEKEEEVDCLNTQAVWFIIELKNEWIFYHYSSLQFCHDNVGNKVQMCSQLPRRGIWHVSGHTYSVAQVGERLGEVSLEFLLVAAAI